MKILPSLKNSLQLMKKNWLMSLVIIIIQIICIISLSAIFLTYATPVLEAGTNILDELDKGDYSEESIVLNMIQDTEIIDTQRIIDEYNNVTSNLWKLFIFGFLAAVIFMSLEWFLAINLGNILNFRDYLTYTWKFFLIALSLSLINIVFAYLLMLLPIFTDTMPWMNLLLFLLPLVSLYFFLYFVVLMGQRKIIPLFKEAARKFPVLIVGDFIALLMVFLAFVLTLFLNRFHIIILFLMFLFFNIIMLYSRLFITDYYRNN